MTQQQVEERRRLAERFIRHVNEEGVNLSPWELEFMESVTEQFERLGTLSDKQLAILERIYTEKTP